MLVPNRTVIVLGVLVAAMTMASALLIALEPGPTAPMPALTLSSIDQPQAYEDKLYETRVPVHPQRWEAVVIYHSGSSHGSADSLSTLHEQLGLKGLACHFVVSNGRGDEDGQVAAGFRWTYQMPGAYMPAEDPHRINERALGICLIGDGNAQAPTQAQFDALVKLTRELQDQFDIPRHQILVVDAGARMFPHARFRQQLLDQQP